MLVKDERNLDKFDRVFGHVFKGLEALPDEGVAAEIPEEWLRKLAEKLLTDEEKAQIEALGGWEKLMETLKKRLEEQKERHQGGSKWIGTGGTSPFGAYGYNPEGVRIGQDKSRNGRAVKVWDKREYKNLDDTRRARHAQHQGRAAPAAPVRARGRAETSSTSTTPSAATARNAGYARHQDGARAAQHGEGAAAARHRRLDGRAHPASARSCSRRRAPSSSTSSIFYFHNCLYETRVEGQPPPPRRDATDLGRCCTSTRPTTR